MSINSTDDLVEGIVKHGLEILDRCQTSDNLTSYINRIEQERLDYPVPKNSIDPANWFIPEKYKNFDIESYCLDLCNNEQEKSRVLLELELYKKHNMIPVLQAIKYVVDTLRDNNVLWGVGRGSSVASYVLFILGVHKIDSIKYNIPLDEFFKGEHNG